MFRMWHFEKDWNQMDTETGNILWWEWCGLNDRNIINSGVRVQYWKWECHICLYLFIQHMNQGRLLLYIYTSYDNEAGLLRMWCVEAPLPRLCFAEWQQQNRPRDVKQWESWAGLEEPGGGRREVASEALMSKSGAEAQTALLLTFK